MAAAAGTASQTPAMNVLSTPSTIATTTSESSSPPQLSEIEELGYDDTSNTKDIISVVKLDGHATGVSSTQASSPISTSDITTPNAASSTPGHVSEASSQGRYDNTVNQYDLIKEASRAKGLKSRTVCVAIPVNRKDGTVLMVTSRKHDTKWICKFTLLRFPNFEP